MFELTRDYDVILPLMLATVIADLVYSAFNDESIMTEKLRRRGLNIGRHYGVDPFTTATVRQIMTTDVQTITPSATTGEVRAIFTAGGHGAYPIVEDRRLVAIISRSDVLRDAADDDDPVLAHASTDVVTVGPDGGANEVLHVMLDEAVEHVPVVEGGVLVGICTRTDLLKIRHGQRTLERRQGGASRMLKNSSLTRFRRGEGDAGGNEHR